MVDKPFKFITVLFRKVSRSMKNMPSDKSSLTMIEFDHLKREGKLKNLFKAKQDLIRAKVPCKRADHRRNIPIYPFNTFKSQHRNRMKVTFPVIFGTKVSCILNAIADKEPFYHNFIYYQDSLSKKKRLPKRKSSLEFYCFYAKRLIELENECIES